MTKLFDITKLNFEAFCNMYPISQPPYCYAQFFGRLPTKHIFPEINYQQFIIELEKNYDLESGRVINTVGYNQENKEDIILFSIYVLAPALMIVFLGNDFSEVNEVVWVYSSEETNPVDLEKLLNICKNSYNNIDLNEKSKVMILVEDKGYRAEFKPFVINSVDLEVHKHYNDSFLPIHNIILNRLSQKDGKGLVVLYGKAGTGKTSYIRHLAKVIDKKILFIPSALTNLLSDPRFLRLLTKYPNSILVIEDAEIALRKRDLNENDAISTLLSLTDGIYADTYKIQVLCTFNTEIENIDSALLRKGRLIAKYEFDNLSVEKSKALAKSLGISATINEPMSLTDLFNFEEINFLDTKKSIGFG